MVKTQYSCAHPTEHMEHIVSCIANCSLIVSYNLNIIYPKWLSLTFVQGISFPFDQFVVNLDLLCNSMFN